MAQHCCQEMQMMVEEENSIVFVEKFQEYGVPSGMAAVLIC